MSNKTKGLIGLASLIFAPVAAEAPGAHPSYGTGVDLGHAVKAYLSVKTNELRVSGDNALQISADLFAEGNVDTETLLDDLEIDSKVFGGTYADGVLSDKDTDAAATGCLCYVQELLKKDKTHVYRAVILYKATAVKSAQKSEADSRSTSGLTFKNKPISWVLAQDNTGDWRAQKEFSTQAAAESWLATKRGAAGTYYEVRVNKIGAGTISPSEAVNYVAAAGSLELAFAADPTVLMDGAADVTASIASHKYTISSIDADHIITAIWTTS